MIKKTRYDNGWAITIEGWGIRIGIARWKK